MRQRSRAILQWEITGTIFIIVVGSALHFVFGWTGGWRPVALIAAVNESIWEHLKLAFWPGLFWALAPRKGLELPLLERLAAKGFTLFLTAVLIVVIFTSYTSILGHNLLLLDIATFVLAVVIGQSVSAALGIYGIPGSAIFLVGLSLFIAQLTAYTFLTYYPPDLWLFVDSRNGLRGIPPT